MMASILSVQLSPIVSERVRFLSPGLRELVISIAGPLHVSNSGSVAGY